MRTEKEKMLAGELYRAVGAEIEGDQLRPERLYRAYNLTTANQADRRALSEEIPAFAGMTRIACLASKIPSRG
ncbi:MAG: hypothetical protein H6842_05175 [Rhodospirillaceae bacterium]|nr:hypothetical protein [Rhodospirillaceae bacterium]